MMELPALAELGFFIGFRCPRREFKTGKRLGDK